MSEELKPCPTPWCDGDVAEGIGVVFCNHCCVQANNIEQWNTRPIEDALREKNEHLVFALRNLVREAEKSGMCDNIIAEMFPENRNRSGAKFKDVAKNGKRAINEAKAILSAMDNDLH